MRGPEKLQRNTSTPDTPSSARRLQRQWYCVDSPERALETNGHGGEEGHSRCTLARLRPVLSGCARAHCVGEQKPGAARFNRLNCDALGECFYVKIHPEPARVHADANCLLVRVLALWRSTPPVLVSSGDPAGRRDTRAHQACEVRGFVISVCLFLFEMSIVAAAATGIAPRRATAAPRDDPRPHRPPWACSPKLRRPGTLATTGGANAPTPSASPAHTTANAMRPLCMASKFQFRHEQDFLFRRIKFLGLKMP